VRIAQLGLPLQVNFTEDDLRTMKVGRRQLRTEWQTAIHAPDNPQKDWRVVLPFRESYEYAFRAMCSANATAHASTKAQLCVFLCDTGLTSEPPAEVKHWVEIVGKYVAIKDYLALSFAIDYSREGGKPEHSRTAVGSLVVRAKPYGGQAATPDAKTAADQLVEACVSFLREMTCYDSADCIVAMPPSDPLRAYNLPRYLAEGIVRTGYCPVQDLTRHVKTVNHRRPIKNEAHENKLDALLETIEVDPDVFQGKTVFLIDDLYQSSTSMNYCALLLLRAGATKIFGLACEKTCHQRR
jgi:hypothetical protein